MSEPTETATPPARETPRESHKRDNNALRLYASLVSAGSLLFACFALFGGLYALIGLLFPALALGHPGNLVRGLIRAAIALPIAAAVLAVHYRMLRRIAAS